MFGRYRIEALLGRGGMGDVHQAFDTRNERTVALKRLRSGLSDEDGFRARFQRESRIVARLSSPHVIPIHDSGEIDGRLYLDMRLVRGRDLAVLLRETGPLGPARASTIVGQVADALHSAHEDELIHRDVKPSNVLLDERGAGSNDFVYLVDFGIAKSTEPGQDSALTGTGAAIGTLAYMSPEMFLGDTIDRRADVYALACMTFELIAGRPPFSASGQALMYEHLNHPPPRLSYVRPGLPAMLDDVLIHGMAKRPADRFATATELAGALARAVTGPQAPVTVTGNDGWAPSSNGAPAQVGPGGYPGAGTPPSSYPGAGTPPPSYPGAGTPPPFHPGGGTPPPSYPGAGTPPPTPRRRLHPALIATIAVLGTVVLLVAVVLGVGAYILYQERQGSSDSASLTALRSVFPRADEAFCQPVGSNPGQTPLATLACGSTSGTIVYYSMWADEASARAYFDSYRAGRNSSDGRDTWTLPGSSTEQGPYFAGRSGADFLIVAIYTGRRYSMLVVGPSAEATAKAFAEVNAVPVEQVPS